MRSEFPTAETAKDFIAAEVAAQAVAENIPLSDAERKMMYYSVDERTRADEIVDQFPDNDPEYEEKISLLLRHAYQLNSNKEHFKAAFKKLAEGDHYLTVMSPFKHLRSQTDLSESVWMPSAPLQWGPLGWLFSLDLGERRAKSLSDNVKLLLTALAVAAVLILIGTYWQSAKEAFWQWFNHVTGK